ncbi:uncharacterized protein LOC143902556 isoform X2 [Temnothorax americanus]|uniref:uncharacterized protein LOC143902556 isoform X2 n=1 Tax=Temnothorax americanus TaxID=1964332 RepID=UPI004068820D
MISSVTSPVLSFQSIVNRRCKTTYFLSVLGAICIGIIGSDYNSASCLCWKECFFLIATSTFFIGTFIFLISYLVSPFTASVLPKTIHERLYHLFATVILFVASLILILEIHLANTEFYNYNELLAASCGPRLYDEMEDDMK